MSTKGGKIASFAVLDLETTGLPDHYFNKSNITEIAIHSISAEDVCNINPSDIPRISHKLTLLFNPLMMIQPKAEELTGLNNYMLEKESPFNVNAGNLIINFLQHLKQPVCLVAHNGDFDFRILKSSFDKLKMELPTDVVCIDSLAAFKELDNIAKEDKQEKVEDPAPITVPESEEKGNPTDWQRLNETTPKRPPNSLNVMRKLSREIENSDEFSEPKQKKSRRSLFVSPNEVIKTPIQAMPYKLENIYRRLFDKAPKVTHHAEADVVMLKEVLIHYGNSFVEYAELNAKPFSDVKKVGAH